MSINLNFCYCVSSLHQLAPIVKDVCKMVLDGIRLPYMRSMSFEANLTEECLLPQAVELRCFILMEFKLIKVNTEVVMRSCLTCFGYICWWNFDFLSLSAHFDNWFLFFIYFDLDLFVAGGWADQTGTWGVTLFYLYLMNVHWCSARICISVLAKSILFGFHLFKEYRSLEIVISLNFSFAFHLFFYLIGDLLIPFHYLYHVMSLLKRFLGFYWFLRKRHRSDFDRTTLTKHRSNRWLNRISYLLQCRVSSLLGVNARFIDFDNTGANGSRWSLWTFA